MEVEERTDEAATGQDIKKHKKRDILDRIQEKVAAARSFPSFDGVSCSSESESEEDDAVLFSPQRRRSVVVSSSSDSDSNRQRGQSSAGEEQEWEEGAEDMTPHSQLSGDRKRRRKKRKKARTEKESVHGASLTGIKKFILCKHCGYMLRGHICAASSSDSPEQEADEENIPPAVVDRDGVIQFNDCVTKKVYDIIKTFSSPEQPICLYNVYNLINQNNIQNGVLRKRRNLKPIVKAIKSMLARGAILNAPMDTTPLKAENVSFVANSDCNFNAVLVATAADTKYPKISNKLNAPRSKVIEQCDKLTGQVLRRYKCMSDACSAMRVQGHYLSYRVFGGGAKTHSCVFTWREHGSKAIKDCHHGDVYAPEPALRAYMQRYLGQPEELVPPWATFFESFSTVSDSDDEGSSDTNQPVEAYQAISTCRAKKKKLTDIGVYISKKLSATAALSRLDCQVFQGGLDDVGEVVDATCYEDGAVKIEKKKEKSLENIKETIKRLPYLVFPIPDSSPDLPEPVKAKRILVSGYAARKKQKLSSGSGSGCGPRVTEQFDKATGQVLRRYRCMMDACVALGQPSHYLSYKVFGSGSRFHSCLFGWRELPDGNPDPLPGEQYANISAMRSYMQAYLDVDPTHVPTWHEYLQTYTPSVAEMDEEIACETPSSCNLTGKRVMEQFDRATNKVLHRYQSMTDASLAMGQSAHYLSYNVFGKGSHQYSCVFGWRELPPGSSVNPREGEDYAAVSHLKAYMAAFFDKPPSAILTWSEFEEKYDTFVPTAMQESSMSADCANAGARVKPELPFDNVFLRPDRSVIEQYDIDTGEMLCRYSSEKEACLLMGLPSTHVRDMFQSVEGEINCVFGWRKIPFVDNSTVLPRAGEQYADLDILRLYIEKYLKKKKTNRLKWAKFLRKQLKIKNASNDNDAMSETSARNGNDFIEECKCDVGAVLERRPVKRRRRDASESTLGRAVEQWDLDTRQVLRRYASMADACSSMGLPVHYLSYKVFGSGARSHSCVFGWTELKGIGDISPKVGEVYADVSALRDYIQTYLREPHDVTPAWAEFERRYTRAISFRQDPDRWNFAKIVFGSVTAINFKSNVHSIEEICEKVTNMLGKDPTVIQQAIRDLIEEGALLQRKSDDISSCDGLQDVIPNSSPDGAVATTAQGPTSGESLYVLNEHFHFEYDDIQVLCLTADCETSLRVFANVAEASAELGVNADSVLRVCRRLQGKTSNLCFRWVDQHFAEYPVLETTIQIDDIKSKHMIHGKNTRGASPARRSVGTGHQSRRKSSNKQICGEFVPIRRPGYPEELSSCIGRRFRKDDSDGNPEVFLFTHVCYSRSNDSGEFFYRYYSISLHPLKRPELETDYHHMLASEVACPDSSLDWVPSGAHAHTVVSLSGPSKTERPASKSRRNNDTEGRRQGAVSDAESCDLSENKANVDGGTKVGMKKSAKTYELMKSAYKICFQRIQDLNRCDVPANVATIKDDLPDEFWTLYEEHSIDFRRILDALIKRGAVEEVDSNYFVNEHFHFEYDDIQVLCLTADCETSLRVFANVAEASAELGVNADSVLRVCRRLQGKTSNLCFRWVDQHFAEYPAVERSISVEQLKTEYMYTKLRGDGCRELEPRRTARARKPAFDSSIFHYVPQTRDNYTSVNKQKLSQEIVKRIGRKFKVPAGDDVYLVCDVCTPKDEKVVLFYKSYSLTTFPVSGPIEESDHLFLECDNMIHSLQSAQWLPEDYSLPSCSNKSESGDSDSDQYHSETGSVRSYDSSVNDSSPIHQKTRPTNVLWTLILGLINKWNNDEPPVTMARAHEHLCDIGISCGITEVFSILRRLLNSGRIVREVDGVLVRYMKLKHMQDLEDATFHRNTLYRENDEVLPISCSTTSGLFIQIFPSIKNASDYLLIEESEIRDCCVGRLKHCGGLSFRWATEQEALKHPAAAMGCGTSTIDYREITESKSAIADRLKRRMLALSQEMCENGEGITVDELYRRVIPEFAGKGVLPVYVEDVLNMQVRKGYILLDDEMIESRDDDQDYYRINPLYRSDHDTAPILCLTMDDAPLLSFTSIREASKKLTIFPTVILSVILKEKSKSTRNLKFMWLEDATEAQVEEASKHSLRDVNDYLDYVKSASRGSDVADQNLRRRKTSRTRQYSSHLHSFHVPRSISGVFKEHEVLDSRVNRTLAASTGRDIFSDTKRHRDTAPTAPACDKPKRGRPRNESLITSSRIDSDKADAEIDYDTGIEGYRDRHNVKEGNEIEAYIPECIPSPSAASQAETCDLQRYSFLEYSAADMVKEDYNGLNSFLLKVKQHMFPPGKVFKVRITLPDEDSGAGRQNNLSVVCSVGYVVQDDGGEFTGIDPTKLNVFDGEKMHVVPLDRCLLENEDLLCEIYWKSFNASHETLESKFSQSDIAGGIERATSNHTTGLEETAGTVCHQDAPSIVQHSNACVSKNDHALRCALGLLANNLSMQWSYDEIVEFVGLLNLYPGEPDMCGKYWRTRRKLSSRSRVDVVTMYYSVFCPTNRIQPYGQLKNVYSCAEFLKGYYDSAEILAWFQMIKVDNSNIPGNTLHNTVLPQGEECDISFPHESCDVQKICDISTRIPPLINCALSVDPPVLPARDEKVPEEQMDHQ